MQPRRFALLVLCLAISSLAPAQTNQDWLPLTDKDFQIKQVPGNADAPAIQLYYAKSIDDFNGTQFIYHRIKILNDGGKKYADVEIPVFLTLHWVA